MDALRSAAPGHVEMCGGRLRRPDPEQQKALADIAGQLVNRLRGEQHPATPTADVA